MNRQEREKIAVAGAIILFSGWFAVGIAAAGYPLIAGVIVFSVVGCALGWVSISSSGGE